MLHARAGRIHGKKSMPHSHVQVGRRRTAAGASSLASHFSTFIGAPGYPGSAWSPRFARCWQSWFQALPGWRFTTVTSVVEQLKPGDGGLRPKR
jgi:hypothetical protein